VELEDAAIGIAHSGKRDTIALSDILAWQAWEGGVSVLVCTTNHVRRWTISGFGQADPAESAAGKSAAADVSGAAAGAKQAGEQAGTTAAGSASPPELDSSNTASPAEEDGAAGYALAVRQALAEISDFLRTHCPERQAQFAMSAAELEAAPVFSPDATRVVVILRDTECFVALGAGELARMQWVSRPRIYAFGDVELLQADASTAFRVQVGDDDRELWKAMAVATAETAPLEDSLVLLSVHEVPREEPVGVLENAMSWEDVQPCRLTLGEGAVRLHVAQEAGGQTALVESRIDALSSRSQVWRETYGVIPIDLEAEPSRRWLVGSNRTLIQLWEHKELRSLTVRTTGVALGKLYQEYNNSRCEKYLAGVFGNFFVAQQQLEQASSVESLVQEIQKAPPGPLPEELNNRLIQRLSILEVSRHQLGRWLDRCALMYPHYMAQCERDWLANVFGERAVDRATQDREAWRVHQQLRGELRQVQASMGKALAEVGQNLNAISWAFPEEVRFAALAGLRRSAGLAEKGAMLAALGGIGGQLLMGIGRASIGDPLGFAMVGALGLSMVGKQLDKNVKEQEKQLRLRAYGVQALQWWDTTLETAAVMALECRRAMELARQAAMLRDRQLLEKLPPEELPKTQLRMIAAMKRALHEDVSSQFYEAVPGSGLFGWHLVDHITQVALERSAAALDRFHGELPGAMAAAEKMAAAERNLLPQQ
jgi:hypothetical protein